MANITWISNGVSPEDNNYDNSNNWSTGTVPGINDTAIFGASSVTALNWEQSSLVNSLQFNAGAPAYLFTLSSAFSSSFDAAFLGADGGQDIDNQSSNTESFFLETSSALVFDGLGISGAVNLTTESGGDSDVQFGGTSTAGNATITTNNTDVLEFFGSSTAGNARLITNGGGVVDFSADSSGTLTAGSIEGAGTYELGSEQLSVGGNNLSTVVSGFIQDGGENSGGSGASLVKTGSGTLTLSGINSYTGGTTISAGTLQLGAGGALGSILGNVTDNATFAIDRSDTFTFGGTISGSGVFEQLGTGTTILTAADSYTGDTIISAGALQLGNGGTSGSIVGLVLDDGILAVDRSDTVTLGAILGNGAFEQLGTGTTILTGANDIVGGTIISAGTLQLGNGGATGSLADDVFDDATFAVDRSGIVTIAGTIFGSGAFEQIGPGTTILTGAADTYGGGTIISAGTLQIGNGGSAGSIPLTNIADNGTLAIDLSSNVTWNQTISGSGAFQQLGGGTTTFSVAQGYTGTTIVSAGMLQLGSGDNLSSGGNLEIDGGTFNLNNNNQTIGDLSGAGGALTLGTASLTAGNANSTAFAGTISGTGNLIKVGTGTLTLTGASNYTGSTTISAGTLQLGNGGAGGSLVSSVLDNAVFAIDESGTLILGSSISGSGLLEQIGTGTTLLQAAVLNGGGITIGAGTLEIGNSGSISGNVTFAVSSNIETLRIDTGTQQLGGSIAGFGASDKIDLAFLAFSTATEAVWQENGGDTGGTLSLVNNGSTLVALNLAGQYTTADFAAVGDGNGGTLIEMLSALKFVGTGDFNHNADADVVFQAADGTPALWIMNGASASQVTEPNPGTAWQLVTTGDFNGDGNADIVFQNVDGTPAIWLMNGTTEVSAATLTNPGTSWQIRATGDFNSDGKSDILFVNANGTPAIWFMNGTTVTNAVALANPGTSWQVIGSGDFFDTGFNNSILWQNVNGTPAIWQMNGGTVVNAFALPNPTASFRIIGTGDFADDGHNDSILFQNNDGQPAIWIMNGTTIVNAFTLPNPGPSWQITGIGDFNGDGNSDIFWQNNNTGQNAVWLMSGSTVVSAQTVTPSVSAQLSGASVSYAPYAASQTGAPAAATSTDLSSSLIAANHAPVLGINSHA